VQRLVDRVRVRISRAPVNAEVKIATTRISVKNSRRGRTIDARRLRARVARALVSASAPRSLRAELQTVRPRVSTEGLANQYATVLTVDRKSFRLRLFKNLELAKTYPIAVGRAGVETPAGLYRIQNKAVDPAWQVPDSEWAGKLRGKLIPSGSPQNPIKARWLGVYDGVGVHGTDDRASIGSNASHGCIRMYIEDVEELYDRVPVGTPIKIA
jgi:lipoprotein-anchoring transpeptidase ErfK/SrfK